MPDLKLGNAGAQVEKGKAIKGAIALIPVGPVSPDLLTWLADRMTEILTRHVIVGKGIPLPQAGYDPRRRQYLGEAILSYPPILCDLAALQLCVPFFRLVDLHR